MALSEWQPQDSGLKQICELLVEYQKPGSNQTQIYQQFRQLCAVADVNNYLVYLLANGLNFSVEVRQSAGLLLKNNLKSNYASLPDEYKKYIQSGILAAMCLPSRPLRQTAGIAAAMMVMISGLEDWPDLLRALGMAIESDDKFRQEGALDTTLKICEDCPRYFEAAIFEGDRTLGLGFVQLLLNRTNNSDSNEVKRLALCILNIITRDLGPHQDNILEMYRDCLFRVAVSEDAAIRKEVCVGMTQMLMCHQEKLLPYLKEIIMYMLKSTQDMDNSVALESCEFWMAFVGAQMDPDVLRPFLPQLIPILLRNMVYEDDDDAVLLAQEAEDEDTVDMDKDIKPFISGQYSEMLVEDETEEDASNGMDEINGNDGGWTLRKSSAGGLDLLSVMFGDELLEVILPIVEKRLQETDWKFRESAILVLGAVSEGCRTGLEPHLDELIRIIVSQIKDPVPMVRIIACWALSRYADRVIYKAKQGKENGEEKVDLIISSILQSLLDKNKKVQEAACSSLATIEEIAGNALFPRLKLIVEYLARACYMYDQRNLRLLYDALSTLAEKVSSALASYKDIIMPPLLKQWTRLGETEKNLQPLMSCFTALAIAMGSAFDEFLQPMFYRCMLIISMQIETGHAIAASQPIGIPYEPDFIVSAFDFISGMLEGLPKALGPLIAQSSLREFLLEGAQHPSADVRQSAFALIGDLARFGIGELEPNVKEFCLYAMHNFDAKMLKSENMSACNNACWALGEIWIRAPEELVKSLGIQVLEKLAYILINSPHIPRSMRENAAITMGRVANICANEAAPHLSAFLGPWCHMLKCIRDDIEKEQAFFGLLQLIKLNPQGAAASFVSVCHAVASWHMVTSDTLMTEIIHVMQTFKQNFTSLGHWAEVWSELSEPVRIKLNRMCDL